MHFLIVAGLIAWAIFGEPSRTIAGWFWEYDGAPWERVDAFYYPDRSNLEKYQQHLNIGGVEECRDWVKSVAVASGDPNLRRGDYECGVGEPKEMYGMKVYRTTVD